MIQSRLFRVYVLYILLPVFAVAPWLTGCANNGTTVPQAGAKPVKVIEVKERTFPVSLEYIGTVQAKEFKKYSLKLPGRIADIPVTEGQQIGKGQVLARLEDRDMRLAAEAAYNNMVTAREAHQFAQDNNERMQALLAAGAVSRQDADRAKLQLDLDETAYRNAQLEYENKKNLLEDTIIRADMDGYIAAVYVKEGEVAVAGYPVLAVRSNDLAVRVGVTQQDFGKITPGTTAWININGEESFGQVTRINQVPDTQTMTYDIEISIEDHQAPLGAAARVMLEMGEEKGVSIPLTSILKSDRDYVFVVEGERAVRKSVMLGETRGTEILVHGLSAGEKLVVEGLKKLEDGDTVMVQP